MPPSTSAKRGQQNDELVLERKIYDGFSMMVSGFSAAGTKAADGSAGTSDKHGADHEATDSAKRLGVRQSYYTSVFQPRARP